MAYGLHCFNNGGELTLSSEAFTFQYMGRATKIASIDYTGTSTASEAGYQTWTFSSTGPILVAVGLKASGQTGIAVVGLSRTSSSLWTIKVSDLSTTSTGPSGATSLYFTQRTDTDVYIFGLPNPALLPAYGMALYNAAGVLTADLSILPLTVASRVNIPAAGSSTSVPALTKPAIIGFTGSGSSTSDYLGIIGGEPTYENEDFSGKWHWNASTTISRVDTRDDRFQDTSPTSSDLNVQSNGILIEANGL